MKVLFVHPSSLMYSKVYLRLEPIGLAVVASSARMAGHEVRMLDLQIFNHAELKHIVRTWRPDAIGFGGNYLANVPEIIDLVRGCRRMLPNALLFVGGHSVSFIAPEVLEHCQGDLDVVVKGEGEAITPRLLEAFQDDPDNLHKLPGCVTLQGEGPAPLLVKSLDDVQPARDLLRRRKKYFIGHLDPCGSVEFARGCPWNCNFCSAWTFYGRSYRRVSPDKAVEDLASVKEPGVFIVDDVAFVHPEHGHDIAAGIEKRGIKKEYYLETRCDVLIKNTELFRRWRRLGMEFMFLGLEAIDEEGLKNFRKRVSLDDSFKALQIARDLDITVAVNIIADPNWDRKRFQVIREWALSVPEVVNISVATPYPGTELWHTNAEAFTTRDYRLFDIQHPVLPTKLPLREFYKELLLTQGVLAKKHMGWQCLKDTFGLAAKMVAQNRQNFVRMLWKFSSVYNLDKLVAEHSKPVKYRIALPKYIANNVKAKELYVHHPLLREKDGITAKVAETATPMEALAAAGAL